MQKLVFSGSVQTHRKDVLYTRAEKIGQNTSDFHKIWSGLYL